MANRHVSGGKHPLAQELAREIARNEIWLGQMVLYLLSAAGGVRDLGECDLDRALAQLETSYEAGLKKYVCAEEAIEKTSFGLSRNDADFIEVSCSGRNHIAIHSDRIHSANLLSRLFGIRHHFWIEGTKGFARSVIKTYFELDRELFESQYSNYLVR